MGSYSQKLLTEELIKKAIYYLPITAISIAAMAASIPLLPCLPPLRSIDCCKVSSVKTQNITGTSNFTLRSLIPCAVAPQTSVSYTHLTLPTTPYV